MKGKGTGERYEGRKKKERKKISYAMTDRASWSEQEYLARVGAIFNALATAAVPAASVAVSLLAVICSVRQIFMVSGLICVLLFEYIKIRKVQFE